MYVYFQSCKKLIPSFFPVPFSGQNVKCYPTNQHYILSHQLHASKCALNTVLQTTISNYYFSLTINNGIIDDTPITKCTGGNLI